MLRAAELKERCGPTTHDDLYCRTGWDQAKHVTGKIEKAQVVHRYARQNGNENEKIQNIKAPSEHMNITCGRWMRVHLRKSLFCCFTHSAVLPRLCLFPLYSLPPSTDSEAAACCRNSGWPAHWYAAVAILVICSTYRIVSLARLKHLNSLIYFVLSLPCMCTGSAEAPSSSLISTCLCLLSKNEEEKEDLHAKERTLCILSYSWKNVTSRGEAN